MPRRRSNLGRRTRGAEAVRRVIVNQTEEERASANERNRQRMAQIRAKEPAERRAARLQDARLRARRSRSAASNLRRSQQNEHDRLRMGERHQQETAVKKLMGNVVEATVLTGSFKGAMGDLCLGQEFHTWHQFSLFFDDWCEKHKVLFIIASLKPLISLRQNPPPYQPSLAETLRFRFVRLICKHSGTYVGQSTVQRNRNSEKIDCPASITLRLGPKKDCLVVTEANLEHNHCLSELEFSHHFKRHQLRASLGLPIRITNSISKRFLAPDLVWNLEDYSKAKDKGMCELLAVLDGLFKTDMSAKVKMVFQEDVAVLNSIFLTTSHMHKLVQRFPSRLFLERAACLNADFELYTILCQDANGRGREVAYCLARQGLPDLLIFMVASLVQSVPGIKLSVKVVTVGAGLTGLDAVEEVLPCARVQICRLQVLEALYSKASELAVPKEDQIRNLLLNLANADSPCVYSQYLSDLEDVAPDLFLQYFLERWHPHKGMWVECWAFEKNRECSFLDHFSAHRRKLLTVLSPPVALAACLKGLLDLQALHVEASTLNVAPVAELYHTVCRSYSTDLVVEELDLVPHAHYKLKESSEGYLLEGHTCSFLVSHDLATCSCSIYMAHQLPCRHIFAIRLWVGRPLFDPSLLSCVPQTLQKTTSQEKC